MIKFTAKAFVAGVVLLFSVIATSAYAQTMPPEVSGKYVNANTGVELTFPEGWSGFEIAGPFGVLVATSPGGLSEGNSETMKSITLVISDKSANKDPRDPSSFSNNVVDCNSPSVNSRTVAGVQGIETTVECPSTAQKFRMVAVETTTNWIAVMYMTPIADFESELAAFDSAVGSLKVQGGVNTEGPTGGPTEETPSTSMMPVMVDGKSVEVSVMSSSAISDFKLDESSKMLSFKTEGTGSETTIAVGKVLEGPYTVMVDGQATQAQESEQDGVSIITIPHTSGSHEVTVTGTQVVPEFPIATIGIIAALIGVVSVIGRTRLMKGKI